MADRFVDLDPLSIAAIPSGAVAVKRLRDMGDGTVAEVISVASEVVPAATITGGAATGTSSAGVADISGATVAANKVFSGAVTLALSASQAAALNAAGTVRLTVTWAPGTSGTTAQVVAAANIDFSATAVAGVGQTDAIAVSVPVVVYAGTTAGKFRVTNTVVGTISDQLWDVAITGSSQ